MLLTKAPCIVGMVFAVNALGAEYRVVAADAQARAGETVTLLVEVETEPEDNVVGRGYFSFAIDLIISGTAGASAFDLTGIETNVIEFDDIQNSSLGFPSGMIYQGAAGVTTDLIPPSFGHNPGDVVHLLTFDLSVPESAQPGDYIEIIPSEGALENLVTGTFAAVSPQRFTPMSITIIPEPSTLVLLLALLPMVTSSVCLRR